MCNCDKETDLSEMSQASYNMLVSSINSLKDGIVSEPVDIEKIGDLLEMDYERNLEYAFDTIDKMRQDELVEWMYTVVGKLSDDELDSFVELLKENKS